MFCVDMADRLANGSMPSCILDKKRSCTVLYTDSVLQSLALEVLERR